MRHPRQELKKYIFLLNLIDINKNTFTDSKTRAIEQLISNVNILNLDISVSGPKKIFLKR